ncbi:nucleotidyl transferase AbiEii/AbiGii toxin family protein [Hallerella succinigenes]|uniref:Nucleotidyltransferase AbiEii toxin of type IV toxin-antitoxin system n=1 Tax=Hallerella succinigenes TaxID=1896222 RepID=A0A2M9A5I6_9BACT|nr:nucleotidyl transferase AbiEii/AbiGii toxin family protein [Hallerella succinigenes]PJJ40984.1 nucleotidyltransferase AbiEii toxin of type IV toxin-antitoxin system [Hallerella succinigenes]
MKINKNSLQARINNLSKEMDVHANVLLVSFFFDAFISRLAKSIHADKFVFKGGFYLATLLGVKNRYTTDIDFLLRRESMDENRLREIFTDIIAIDADDSITFEISDISPIRDEDAYGGFSILLTGHLENVRQSFHVDVATGDPITPKDIEYSYQSLISNETIAFRAYNLETVVAEKLQTILFRRLLNSRCKDYYDIYIIHQLQWRKISIPDLRKSFETTCQYRKTPFEKEKSLLVLEEISKSDIFQTRWKNYAKKSSFAKGISFEATIEACKEILDCIF